MQDPFPIANVFHVTNTYVDAATVVVTDLCENLSNSIKVDSENILEQLKKNLIIINNCLFGGRGRRGRLKICSFFKILVQVQ